MELRNRLRIQYALACGLGWLTRCQDHVRILTYHSIQSEPDLVRHVPPRLFEEHLAYLVRSGYKSLRVCDLVARWPAVVRESRVVVLTFDDGLLNNRTVACPILEKWGMTATFFVPTACVGQGRGPAHVPGMDAYRNMPVVSWDDLRAMVAEGFEIGGHSHRHVKVSRQSRREAREEIRLPKRILEEKLGVEICSFAYPKGHSDSFSEWTGMLLAKSGYRAGCTMVSGPVARTTNLLQLPRTGITGMDDLRRFRLKLQGNYDLLTWLRRHP